MRNLIAFLLLAKDRFRGHEETVWLFSINAKKVLAFLSILYRVPIRLA